MESQTICTECKRLRDAHEDVTIKYMRFHNGTRQDAEEGQRLFEQMTDSKNALLAHQQQHTVRN